MSIEKSSVQCHHGKGFNCKECWPQEKSLRQYGREFQILAEFPATETGTEHANQFMAENEGTALLVVKQGRAIVSSVEDEGVPVAKAVPSDYEQAFEAAYKLIFERLAAAGWKFGEWHGMAKKEYATGSGLKPATAYVWRLGPTEGKVHLRGEFLFEGRDVLSTIRVDVPLSSDKQLVCLAVEQFLQEVNDHIAKSYARRLQLNHQQIVEFEPTGSAGEPWYLADDGASLELIANGSPIARIPLDIYEENDFSQLNQALANAQLFLKSRRMLEVLKQTELALSSGNAELREGLLQTIRLVIQEASEKYTGPTPSILK